MKWKVRKNQKELLDVLFRGPFLKNAKRVLDMGSGRTSLSYLTDRFKNTKIQAVVYPGDERKMKPILEHVRRKNYKIIETDIKRFKPKAKFDVVLAHLFLGEAEKFGRNKFKRVLDSLLSIKTRYLAIVDVLNDKDVDYALLLDKLEKKGKLIKIVYVTEKSGEKYVGFLVKKR